MLRRVSLVFVIQLCNRLFLPLSSFLDFMFCFYDSSLFFVGPSLAERAVEETWGNLAFLVRRKPVGGTKTSPTERRTAL